MTKVFVLSVILLLSLNPASLQAANWSNNQGNTADTSISMRLTCETRDYSQSKYPLDWSKSWIPENYTAVIQGSVITTPKGQQGRVLRVTKKRIEFIFDDFRESRNDLGYVKGTYFRTNGKITARVEFGGGYRASGPIWGQCKEETLAKAKNSSSLNTDTTQPKKDKNSPKDNHSLSEAKKECASIGYKPATEKYADCVMKLMD